MKDLPTARSCFTAVLVAVAFALVPACGGEEPTAGSGAVAGSSATGGAESCPAGELTLEGGGCLAAGMHENGCAAGELAVEGAGCRPAGIPPELCGEGFAPDARGGCEPILPSTPCARGLMAVPGETACREVAPCGTGTWGDVPVEADTEYVDAAYAEAGSDGTQGKPWTTIQAGVTAAAPGAIVAVAKGSYVEDVSTLSTQGKAVRIWGRCPAMVEIAGSLQLYGPGGSEVRDLAVRGAAGGITLVQCTGVVIDRVWIHDTAGVGLALQDSLGPSQVSVTRSLFEATTDVGIFVSGGSDATIESTVVRDTQPHPSDQGGGRGVLVTDWEALHTTATVHGCVIDHNRMEGVRIEGSTVTIEATVVRDTQPQASDGAFGFGLVILDDDTGRGRATVTLRSSVIDHNRDAGVFVVGSDLAIENTVVRDTQPQAADQMFGRGISLVDDPSTGERAAATVRSCVVAQNHETGVLVQGSDITIEATVVRDTRPQESDQAFGGGIDIEATLATEQRATAIVRSCIVEQNRQIGIAVLGSDATIEATIVRDTQPQASDKLFGRGIDISESVESGARATGAIRSSLVERNLDAGIVVGGSDATVDATVVRDTQPQAADGRLGDGLTAVLGYPHAPASAVVRGSRIEGSARAGIANFGASLSLGMTLLECNGIDLNGEVYVDTPASWEDLGGAVCGCSGQTVECSVGSSNLEPTELPQTQ